jgi:RimJ/RimL family protein N-acetyltransferase
MTEHDSAVHPLTTVEVDGYAILEAGRPLRLQSVRALDDIMYLRQIRNECREYMTQHTDEISEADQLLWWQRIAGRPDWRVWLVYTPALPEPIGFAMLRQLKSGYWFTTLGLRAWVRGNGFGTALYRTLRALCVDDVYAVVRQDNIPSQRAAIRAGYEPLQWQAGEQVAFRGRKEA